MIVTVVLAALSLSYLVLGVINLVRGDDFMAACGWLIACLFALTTTVLNHNICEIRRTLTRMEKIRARQRR